MNRKEKKFLRDYEKQLHLSSSFNDIKSKIEIKENSEMKLKRRKLILTITLAVSLSVTAIVLPIALNSNSNSNYQNALLRTPIKRVNESLNSINISESDYFDFIHGSLNEFSMNFASQYYNYYYNEEGNDNSISSPLSLYFALAMLVECSNGTTRNEILHALNMNYNELAKFSNALYLMSSKEKYIKEYNKSKLISVEELTNSIWMKKNYLYVDDTLDTLTNDYYCYPHSVDFKNDNKNVNKMIRNFIKEKTRGLIQKFPNIEDQTEFLLMNTLYIKDIWNSLIKELSFTENDHEFQNYDNTLHKTKLLVGKYIDGRIQEGNCYRTFYTKTDSDYKLKFILPKEGYKLDEVFKSDVLKKINNITDYQEFDYDDNNQEKIHYNTRCIFPEFEVSNDYLSLNEVLSNLGIVSLFDHNYCDLSNIILGNSNFKVLVSQANKLSVNAKGIEGAAVTMVASGDSGPLPIENVYEDFIIDKSFGFILTDYYDVPIFSGSIRKLS